jgi:hypothetical protein
VSDTDQHSQTTTVGPALAPILEVVRGNERGQTLRLKLKTRLGRERDNDLTLTDPRVSRYHAWIELVESEWTIRDGGSANGTFVNGKRVSVRPLKADDRITIGDTELAFQPSRPGANVAARPGGSRLPPPEAAPQRRNSAARRGWAWIAGGAVLILVLLGGAVWFQVGGRLGQAPAANRTTEPDSGSGIDFVLVYQDDFSDPNSGWDDASDRYTSKQYGNAKYYIEVTTSNLTAWGLANRDVANFRLEVETSQESGPNNSDYGVLFRFKDHENYYRFDISGEGYFLLSKFYQGEWSTLVPLTASSALKLGRSTNKLMVEAIGEQFRVFANGVQLAEAKDSALSHGNFGFFANTLSDPSLVVSYDNIELWIPRGEALAVIPTPTPTRPALSPTAGATTSVPAASATPEGLAEATATAIRAAVTVGQTALPPASPAPLPSPNTSPTPVPLPEYASRDLPPARKPAALAGRFFYPVYDPTRGTYDIFSAMPSGDDRQLVAKQASQPALNADGSRIAFRSWQPDKRGLIERAVSGGDEWRFNTFFESARPTFAPDGQSLLYHSRQGGQTPAIYRTINTDSQVLRREGGPIQGQSPAWVSKNRFVYQGCLGVNCGLIVSNLDGSFPRQITQDPSDTNPAVSPDGQTVLFMSRRTGNWEVYEVGIDGAGLEQLTSDPGNDGLPIWAASGKTIAYVSDRDGVWELWAMDTNGRNERPLFKLAGSPDGQVQSDVQNSRGWLEERIAWSP